MLKTCFGCCPLRHGVSTVAFINMLWNILEIFKHVYHRYGHYGRTVLTHTEQNNTSAPSNDENTTETYPDYYTWAEFKVMPVMSGMFMDYIFVVTISWIFLEIISNIYLKQSTFKHAPHKIYIWLTTYYANLTFMILNLLCLIKVIRQSSVNFASLNTTKEKYLMVELVYILMIAFEIFIVHSFYIMEKNTLLNDFIQLKWKYVSKGNVISKGLDYPSTSLFAVETSNETQYRSKIPPCITNILQ